MVIIGTVIIIVGFYIANAMAPLMTTAAADAGFAIPEGAAQIASVADGFIWIPWAFMTLGGLLGWIGLAIMVILLAVLFFFYLRAPKQWEVAAGGPKAEVGAD
jgi:PTS system galactitol-specific IIC component